MPRTPLKSSAKGANIRHSSAHAEHYTPPEVIEAAREVLGGVIDLDPASSDIANRVVRAGSIFTISDNGFTRPWHGSLEAPTRVFLNPPGGSQDARGVRIEKGETGRDGRGSAQKAWWFKLAEEWLCERVHSAIFVGFSVEILQTTQVDPPRCAAAGRRSEMERSTLPIPLDFPMCFPARRLAYYVRRGEELVRGASPPHASVLVYLPPRAPASFGCGIADFARVFGEFGRVVRPQLLPFMPEVR